MLPPLRRLVADQTTNCEPDRELNRTIPRIYCEAIHCDALIFFPEALVTCLFPSREKYKIRDYRGGGRSSARETAVRVAAGAVAFQVLKQRFPKLSEGGPFYNY